MSSTWLDYILQFFNIFRRYSKFYSIYHLFRVFPRWVLLHLKLQLYCFQIFISVFAHTRSPRFFASKCSQWSIAFWTGSVPCFGKKRSNWPWLDCRVQARRHLSMWLRWVFWRSGESWAGKFRDSLSKCGAIWRITVRFD